MSVVGHAAETLEPIAVALDSLLEQPIRVILVSRIEGNILFPVPTKDHMIDPSRYMKAWFSGHGPIVMERLCNCSHAGLTLS